MYKKYCHLSGRRREIFFISSTCTSHSFLLRKEFFFPASAKATKERNCTRPVPRDLEMHSLKSGPSHPTTSIAEQRRLLSRRQSSPRTTFLISLSRVARKNKDGVGEEELAFQENGQRGIRRKVFAPTAIFFCFSFLLARFGRRTPSY